MRIGLFLIKQSAMKEDQLKVSIPLVPERKARAFLARQRRAARLATQAAQKAQKNKAALQKVWDDLLTLTRLLRAWARRGYTAVPWQTLVAVTAALIYFINPFDLIPDFLPTLGLVDDATLIGLVVASIREDLSRFRAWERKQSSEI